MRKKISESNIKYLEYMVANKLHKNNYAQKDLAKLFGVTPSTISNYIKNIEEDQASNPDEINSMPSTMLAVGVIGLCLAVLNKK